MSELIDVEQAAAVDDVGERVADSDARADVRRGDDVHDPVPTGRVDRLLDWIGRRSVADILVTSAIVLYTAYFTKRSLDVHHALGTASYDSAHDVA